MVFVKRAAEVLQKFTLEDTVHLENYWLSPFYLENCIFSVPLSLFDYYYIWNSSDFQPPENKRTATEMWAKNDCLSIQKMLC